MTPPIFQTANVPAVQALLKSGNGPLRFYAWGLAPQNVEKPYAVWRQVYGTPENYLGDRPDIDNAGLQIDCYADSSSVARSVGEAIQYAIELSAYVVSGPREDRDPETMNYVFSFDTEWWTPR